jgi:hypothetical protein
VREKMLCFVFRRRTFPHVASCMGGCEQHGGHPTRARGAINGQTA